MSKIAIITDTSSNLNFEIAKKYDIFLIPYNIQIGDKTYKDLYEIKAKDFYDIIEEKNVLTAVPSPNEILNIIRQKKNEGYDSIIFFTMSENLSGMYNLQNMVIKEYEEELKNIKIKVICSNTTAMGTGLLAIYGSKLRQEGKSFEEIINIISLLIKNEKLGVWAIFRTLKYVIRGGRLPKIQGTIGEILKIQPILSMNNGSLSIIEKVRGEKLSRTKMLNIVKKDLKYAKRYYLGFFNSQNEREDEFMREEMKEYIENAEVFLDDTLTSVMGVHAGPSCIGICYLILE